MTPTGRHARGSTPANQDSALQDSGEVETLPDGSISIPVFEEQVVVTRKLVVRERIVVHKQVVVTDQVVTADLHREQVEIESTGEVRIEDR